MAVECPAEFPLKTCHKLERAIDARGLGEPAADVQTGVRKKVRGIPESNGA
jgi:hypothetical protein